MIVVDASVAAKWMLVEPGGEAAAALLRDARKLIAPAWIRFEVTGAIVRRVRTGEMEEAEARAACCHWDDILARELVELIPSENLLEIARDFALHARHGLADCLYLAAGKLFSAEVVTADPKLRDRGQKVYARVTLLDGFASH